MTRLHLHLGVEHLDQSIRFYSALFGSAPVKIKADYAKWMLSDPPLSFAISTRSQRAGVDHLGLQVDGAAELETVRDRLKNANVSVTEEGETVCCYALSEKTWVRDPAGIPWEAYRTMEEAHTFNDAPPSESACCVPQAAPSSCGVLKGSEESCCG